MCENSLFIHPQANTIISDNPDVANKKFWHRVGDEIKAAKDNMQPLLKNWLLAGIESK